MTDVQAIALAGLALQIWVTAQIWLVQVVIYPLFAFVGADEYVGYHRYYSRRIPLPVIVPGFVSFFMPILIAVAHPSSPMALTVLNIACGLIGLVVTLALEIPRHNRLERNGRDQRLIAELVRFNWPRTASITVQAITSFAIVALSFGWPS